MPEPQNRLETQLGITFRDGRLLQSALVHRSFIYEHPEKIPGLSSNERLEFLGDAILNFFTAAWLYQRFPKHSEGQLTELRARLVRTESLASFARELHLGDQVRIGRGEDNPLGRNRPALLADLFEAVVGAIYLDQGLDAVQQMVTPFLERQLALIMQGADELNYRTLLQEQTQARFGQTPVYRELASSGPPHQMIFTMAVLLGEQIVGEGRGPTKQSAAQAAAQQALARLDQFEA
ncbi:MAG: ribonuclease III [Oscillochloridaceae bacterium umkhey_bin13]